MPADEHELDAAAQYAALLPDRFDLVQLGLGLDGYAASLVAEDAPLDVRKTLVTVTGEYQGRRRMTFTYPVLAPRRRDAVDRVG